MIDIIKKIVSPINYFTYKGEIYKILDLPMETLYKNTDTDIKKKLITDEKLFSSTQKYFIDEHINIDSNNSNQAKPTPTYNPNIISFDLDDSKDSVQLPISASFYMSRSSFGIKSLDDKNI